MRFNLTYGKFTIELEGSSEEELASLFEWAQLAMELCPETKQLVQNNYTHADAYNSYSDAYRNAFHLKVAEAFIAKRLVFLAKHTQEAKNPNVAHEQIVLASDDPRRITHCVKWLSEQYDLDFNPISHLLPAIAVDKLTEVVIKLENTHAYQLVQDKLSKFTWPNAIPSGQYLYKQLCKAIIKQEEGILPRDELMAKAEAMAETFAEHYSEIEAYYNGKN